MGSPDYAEILRLHRKYRLRDDEPLWKVFVRVGQEFEKKAPKERCPACGHTDVVYERLIEPKCSAPWHGR
jgi:rubrerythrin